MGTVHAEIEIEATPEAVWAVLSDLSTWPDWNEVIIASRCDGGEGARLSCKVRIGPIWFPVESHAHTWDEAKALVWGEDRGRLLRIFHGFRLHPAGDGTRVEHYESFEGAIGRLAFPIVRGTLTRNYRAFLTSLKQRVENP